MHEVPVNQRRGTLPERGGGFTRSLFRQYRHEAEGDQLLPLLLFVS